MSARSSMVRHASRHSPSLLWVINIPLCGQTTYCLSVHLLVDTWVVSTFGLIISNAAMSLHEQMSDSPFSVL